MDGDGGHLRNCRVPETIRLVGSLCPDLGVPATGQRLFCEPSEVELEHKSFERTPKCNLRRGADPLGLGRERCKGMTSPEALKLGFSCGGPSQLGNAEAWAIDNSALSLCE